MSAMMPFVLNLGKNEDGRKRAMPTENVIVKNNIVYHGHGGFTVGSEMSGGVRNVHISNCTFIGTDIGLRFKSTRGRGGIVENIYISNINMVGIPAEAIGFNLFYEGKSPILESAGGSSINTELESEAAPVDETTPAFRNIHMKDITVTASGTAAFFQGLPEMKLQNITLENAVLEAEKGITLIDADGIILKNVKVIHKQETAMVIYNSANIELNKFTIENEEILPLVRLLGKETKAIRLIDSALKLTEVYVAQEVPANELVIEPGL
jgi:polygalacturonase